MAEYIEREKAIAICQSHYEHCLKMHDFSGDSVAYDIRSNIQGLPTADVVEVVRCKDCQSYSDFDTTKCKRLEFHFCDKFGIITKESDFCSYGKRKEGAENA